MIARMQPLILFLVLFGLICPAQGQQPPIPVVAVKVESQLIEDQLEALGTLKANESVVLTSSVTETVTAVHFDDGARVKAGQVLLEMTSSEEHAQLQEFRSRIEEAKLQYDRVLPLTKSGSAPASLADERRREYETAQAQLQAIESRLADRLIKAPFDGVIGLRNISVGSLIAPGDPIATLDDDSIMKLDFSVPSTALSELKQGTAIVAKARALENLSFEGKISSIDSRIDPVTRSITVRALLDNKDRLLKPGLLMTVKLLFNRRRALLIPEEALVKDGNKNYVFSLKDQGGSQVFEKCFIEIGTRRPGSVEVTAGLSEGQLIVTHWVIKDRPGLKAEILSLQHGSQPLKQLLDARKDKS